MNLIGSIIDDRYRVLRLIGEGGMGAVFEAEQRGGPNVAIKVLHEELTDQPELRERFEREARALFALEHPNVLGVFDFGVVGGMPYLAMELLQGQSLDEMVEDGPLEVTLAYDLACQVLRGLAFAHSKAVLHRDLKTENVFVSRAADGSYVAKLLDFGLVKFVDDDRWGESKNLTVQGAVMGTPAYMAPEQCAGAPVDTRGDVYSAGVIVFELFTGLWPFMEEDRISMFQAHFGKPVPRMSDVAEGRNYPDMLEQVVQKAMAKKADDRYQDAGEMLAALEQAFTASMLPSAPAAHAVAAAALPPPGMPHTPSVHAPRAAPVPADMQPSGGQTTMWVVLGVVVALVLALGAGAAFWLLGG